MKIVLIKAPKAVTPILRKVFKISKNRKRG